ncbi:MAG: hypothetical protein V1778_05295 [bacterium]
MQITISFNWPPATESARVFFGSFNIEDPNFLVKVGVITKADPVHVRWLKAQFLDNDMLNDLTFDVKRGDKVVVEKYAKENKTTPVGSYSWDTGEKWPPEANGGTSTDIPWAF